MTARRPVYCYRHGAPFYRQVRPWRWVWQVRDGMTGPVLAEGRTLTERGAHRAIERVLRRCVCVEGVCRVDLPVRHALTASEATCLSSRLERDGVPVTVRVDGPDGEVILWPALALTSRQMAHTLVTVRRETDAPVHWAGA